MDEQQRIANALDIASDFGQSEGDHHLRWVIDQMVRYLTNCPTVDREAIDCRGNPYTFPALGESDEYRAFIAAHNEGKDGYGPYSWDAGVVP